MEEQCTEVVKRVDVVNSGGTFGWDSGGGAGEEVSFCRSEQRADFKLWIKKGLFWLC